MLEEIITYRQGLKITFRDLPAELSREFEMQKTRQNLAGRFQENGSLYSEIMRSSLHF